MARWSDVIDFIQLKEGLDDSGFPSIVEGDPRQVFANKKSIRSEEYHLAKQQGISLTFMFEVRSIDYEGETKLIFMEEEHIVERTYDRGEFIELVCKREGDNHHGSRN